jgi:hypothetical protein
MRWRKIQTPRGDLWYYILHKYRYYILHKGILKTNLMLCHFKGVTKLSLHIYTYTHMCMCVCIHLWGVGWETRYGTGVWTQGIALARQAFYSLSLASSPFCSSYSGDRVSFFAWAEPECDPSIPGLDDRCETPRSAFFHWYGVLQKSFYPGLAWNSDLPDVCTLGWQLHTIMASYWLRSGLGNILLKQQSSQSQLPELVGL